MSSRRRAREYALQALFQCDLAEIEVPEGVRRFWAAQVSDDGTLVERPVESDEAEFTERLLSGVSDNHEAIEERIEAVSTNWRVARMPGVDRNILRLAAFELLFCTDIPANVTINEAIELAKRFGGAESSGFVNGILDRIAHEAGRGGRNA
jgi:N utilization substance protein B